MNDKIVAGKMLVRSMSANQRRHYILDELKVPKYLKKHLKNMDSQLKTDFESALNAMSKNKLKLSIDHMRHLLELIDNARWATPKAEEFKPLLIPDHK